MFALELEENAYLSHIALSCSLFGSSLLVKNPHSDDAKKARAYILRLHPTWKIPERRVQKFVKKQQVHSKCDRDGEQDDQSVSSVTRRVKGMMKKILVFHKPLPHVGGGTESSSSPGSITNATTELDEVPPIKEIHATSFLLPPASFEDTSVGDEDVLSPIKETNKAVDVDENDPVLNVNDEKEKGIPLDEVMVYKDDNDGKKDRCCAPCEGCIVM